MQTIFQADVRNGYLEMVEVEGYLIVCSGFRRGCLGVNLELPREEAADLTEALLRHLDEPTRLSVIQSVMGKTYEHVEQG